MAAGSAYPAEFQTAEGIVREGGQISFTDSTNQPAPGGSANEAVAKDFKATGLTGAVTASRYVGATASVAPAAGTFAVGDYIVTATGRMWVCTVAGTPGTWVEPASVAFAPLASPTLTGTVTVPAAAAVTSATRLSDLSSALTLTSGTLPNTGAWVSGTAKVNPVTRQIVVSLEIVTDGTANAATCAVAISPDNVTFTTIATPGASVGVNTAGAITLLAQVLLPAAWFIKITFARCTVAASIYY